MEIPDILNYSQVHPIEMIIARFKLNTLPVSDDVIMEIANEILEDIRKNYNSLNSNTDASTTH